MHSDILWYQDGQWDYLGLEIAETPEQATQRVYAFGLLMLVVFMLQFQDLVWSCLADLPAQLQFWAMGSVDQKQGPSGSSCPGEVLGIVPEGLEKH